MTSDHRINFVEPSNPTSFTFEEANVTKAIEYIEKLNKENPDTHVTMTHVFGWGLGYALYKMRRDVGRITFGFFKWEKSIGITILVDVEGGSDLVPVTIWDAHKISVVDFAKLCNEKVQRAKKKQDN